MTPQEIHVLDGSGLTRLAFTLSLAPSGAKDWQHDSDRYTGVCIVYVDALTNWPGIWAPHKRLDQAEAVFRKLRTYGCCTMLTSTPQGGKAEAWCFPGGQSWEETFGESAQEEALALLRVACIAAACLTYG